MDEQTLRSGRARRPQRWGRALLLVGMGGALIVLALLCAYGADLHGGVGIAACQSRPTPDDFPPEDSPIAHRTLVPLGTACEFDAQSGRSVLSPEPDWSATWIAVAGSGLLAGAAVSLVIQLSSRTSAQNVR